MSFLCNNIAAITVALVASVVAWLFGGARADLLLPVAPWLSVLLVEVLVCFPQRHEGETTYDARTRAWRDLRESKIVWISLAFLMLLVIPFFNDGLCPTCDAALIAQGANPRPPFRFLPFCVDRLDHLNVVLWFLIALPSLIAVRYCLTRRGKRLVLELIVWNGVALALLGFVQSVADAPGPFWTQIPVANWRPEFFSSFGYPNMAGDYFVTLFGLAVALWREKSEYVRRTEMETDPTDLSGREARNYGSFWKRHYFLMPAALFFLAAINTLSRAAIVLVAVSALVYFAHTLAVFLARMKRARRVIVGVWSVLVFVILVFFAIVSMPGKMRHELGTLGTREALDRVTTRAQYHGRVAPAIWKDHPLFGVGGWGYAHFSAAKMKALDIPLHQLQKVGGANVHNDYLQCLVELGLAGFAALVAIVVLLLWPVVDQWRALIIDLRFGKRTKQVAKPIAIFALPAPAFFILVTALSTMVHAFGDCPFRSCAVLDLFFISLAAIPGFLPRQFADDFAPRKANHHHHHQTST